MVTARQAWMTATRCLTAGLTVGWVWVLSAQSEERVWPVEATPLIFATYEVERAFSGTVSSPSAVDLSFAQAGCITTVAAGVRDGAQVSPGSVLFQLDDRDAVISLAVAEASASEQRALVDEKIVSREAARSRYDRQLINLARAEEFLVRDQGLADRNLISATVVESARRSVWEQEDAVASALESLQQAEAAVTRSEATRARVVSEVDKAALVVDLHRVAAPFAGVLVQVSAQAGDCVTSGQALATLARTNDRQVDFFVPLLILDRPDGPRPGLGTPARIEKANGTACMGDISSIAGTALEESQLVAVTITVVPDCAASLLINEAVRVSLVVRQLESVAALPASAIRENKRIFVVDADNRLQSRDLDMLEIFEGVAYVLFDPAGADKVVTTPPALAVDGMAVTLSTSEP